MSQPEPGKYDLTPSKKPPTLWQHLKATLGTRFKVPATALIAGSGGAWLGWQSAHGRLNITFSDVELSVVLATCAYVVWKMRRGK